MREVSTVYFFFGEARAAKCLKNGVYFQDHFATAPDQIQVFHVLAGVDGGYCSLSYYHPEI